MSQEKVDAYKKEKKNRQKIMKRESFSPVTLIYLQFEV